MKNRPSFLRAGSIGFRASSGIRAALAVSVVSLLAAGAANAATYDPTNGYVGAQTSMLTTDANVSTANPLIFNVTSGYFENGNNFQTYTNATVTLTSLVMNNGYSGASTGFTGAVTGSGPITLTSAGLAQDFVFTGDMTGYTGNTNVQAGGASGANQDISTTLGDRTSSVIQFGGTNAAPSVATVAPGTVSAGSINNVSGSGSITALNVVYNYVADSSYNDLVATNNISAYQLAQLGSATINYTGTVTGRVTAASGNFLTVNAGSANFTNTVSNFGNLALGGGNAEFAQSTTFATTLNVTANGTLTVDSGATVTSSGATTIDAGQTLTVSGVGTLLANGTSAATGAVTVDSGATLGGTGTLGAAITLNGNITGGTDGAIGTLTTGALTLNGTYKFDLNSTTNTSDQLISSGLLTVGGTLAVNDLNAGTPTSNLIIAQGTSLTGEFTGLAQGALVDGGLYTIDYGTLNPNAVTLMAIPEPSTVALAMIFGVGMLFFFRRRRIA